MVWINFNPSSKAGAALNMVGTAALEEKLLVYGAKWCPDVSMVCSYLDRHDITYEFHDIDVDPEARNFLLEVSGQDWLIPTLVLPGGEILVNPSIRTLADKLGRPQRRQE